MSDEPLHELYARPGFKIRRCHQIAVSIFVDECRAFDLTTTQYGMLCVLSVYPGIDQISLARLLGLDRSTTATVVGRLEERGLLRRDPHADDRRRRRLELTAAGRELLAAVKDAAKRAQERLLAPFDAEERVRFLEFLDRIMEANNADTRVPLEPAQRLRLVGSAG